MSALTQDHHGGSSHIRVIDALNGTVYPISISIGDSGNVYIGEDQSPLTVSNIKRHLTAIFPSSDQILLLGDHGTSFKVPRDDSFRDPDILASLCGADGGTGGSSGRPPLAPSELRPAVSLVPPAVLSRKKKSYRLYLFSRSALTVHGTDPPPCVLKPMQIRLPTEPEPSPVTHALHGGGERSGSISPLYQALEVYERQFMLHLCRGRVLADGADLRMDACRICVSEQRNMFDGLCAAASNLSDHRNNLIRSHQEFQMDFTAKTTDHLSLLQDFEQILSSVGAIPLHPALVAKSKSNGLNMTTLLDTVPVEKERHWAAQCRNSHQRLSDLYSQLEADVRKTIDARDEESREDGEWEAEIQSLTNKIEGEACSKRNEQGRRLDILINNHGEVVRVIMGVVDKAGSLTASSVPTDTQSAFSFLEDLSCKSSDVMPSMESDDVWLMSFMKEVAEAKTKANTRVRTRLRQISVAQSSIQKVLSELTVLREALQQQCQNMVHLEHVRELSGAYSEFLSEVRRRRLFSSAFSSSMTAIVERAAAMKNDETRAREKFLRGPGRHLMPVFFDLFVPTLASPPPLYAPPAVETTELSTLPDVGLLGEGEEEEGLKPYVSSVRTEGGESTDGETDVSGTGGNQQSLIVSAEISNENMLVDNPVDRAASEAERAAILYENAALRQAVERLGGKLPRTYVDDAREIDRRSEITDNAKSMAALRSKLEETEEELNRAREDAKNFRSKLQNSIQKAMQEAKISHSSFSIGDVALFMPTGRDIGGRRTYLAFHSSCPHRYLNNDSIQGNPDYVLGKIVLQEEHVAGPVGESNPFGLRKNTKFWVLTVEVVKIP